MNDSYVCKRAPSLLYWLCWMAYATSYITKLCYAISMNGMVARGLFSPEFAGAVGTGLLACYGCGQLVNGRLGDRFNPRFMIGFGLTGSALMNILMGLAEDKFLIFAVWCINGFCCSMLWAPVLRCISEYLPEERKSKAGALISATIPVGTIAAYALGGLLLKIANYKALFFTAGGIGLLMATVWLFGTGHILDYLRYAELHLKPSAVSASGKEKKPGFASLVISTGAVFAIGSILFNGILKDGVTLWLPTYLNDFFGVSDSSASTLLIILPLFNLAGAFIAVRLNSRLLKNELTTVTVMFGVSVIGLLFLILFGKYSVILATLFMAICTASMLGANTMLLTFIPMNFATAGRTSTLTGLLDACSYIASAVSGVTIGLVAENYGWGTTVLSWECVAVLGLAVSAIGIPFWKRGLRMLRGN